jgi:hypothetical protein
MATLQRDFFDPMPDFANAGAIPADKESAVERLFSISLAKCKSTRLTARAEQLAEKVRQEKHEWRCSSSRG